MKLGDGIAVVAPARYATLELVREACELIETAGFKAVVPDGIEARDGQFGGDDEHRAAELNGAFRDKNVRAVLALSLIHISEPTRPY